MVLSKVEYVFPVVVDSMLPHVEFGPNDYLEDASHFISSEVLTSKGFQYPFNGFWQNGLYAF